MSDCNCGTIGRTDLRQCEHFHIWRGDVRLTSVGSIIRTCWPQEICKSCEGLGYKHKAGCPIGEKIENARNRGSEVDKLFAAYVLGKLDKIPAGTREDSRDLFLKLMKWYESQRFSRVEVQVLLADTDYGGVLDFRLDGIPLDLKCTYNVEETSRLQIAGYARMCPSGHPGAILHVTERIKEPKWIELTRQDGEDWQTLVECWRMIQRRTK